MRFNKNISLEKRKLLSAQLKKYEKEFKMTTVERKELHEWVASGHSPYDNGDYIYGENGYPMDFISAYRFVNEKLEWFSNLPESEKEEFLTTDESLYDTKQDISIACIDTFMFDIEADIDLPF